MWTDVARFIAGQKVPGDRPEARSRGQHLLHLFSRS